MVIGKLALLIAAFITGAAFYVNFAEQPARLKLEPSHLLAEWLASHKRGFLLQAPLTLLCGVAGAVAYYLSHDWRWLVGAGFILMNVPFTLIVMLPINRKLFATPIKCAGPETVQLIVRWGSHQAIRTLFGACSAGLFFWALQ
jgi:hypothetical protein